MNIIRTNQNNVNQPVQPTPVQTVPPVQSNEDYIKELETAVTQLSSEKEALETNEYINGFADNKIFRFRLVNQLTRIANALEKK
jgi:exonuclease VII small subunit